MITDQIYNNTRVRIKLLISILILFFSWGNLKAQVDEAFKKTDEVIDKTSQGVQKTEETASKIEAQQAKAGKFKSFVRDSIPAYTEQFGSYLKKIIEQQNRFDYLDEVPKNAKQSNLKPKIPQRIIQLTKSYNAPQMSELEWTGIDLPPFNQKRRDKRFSKEVYAFHSFSEGNSYERYDWNALTRLAYMGYLINPKTGSYLKLPNWNNSNIHKRAVQYQVDVDLVAQILDSSSTRTFLRNEKAWTVFADSIITQIQNQHSNGIVIDFFGLTLKDKANYLEFVKLMKYRLGEASPRFQLSIALPPNDIDDVYSAQEISNIADRVLIMAMDYHNYNGFLCGPTAPLISNTLDAQSIDASYNLYTKRGVKNNKMVLILGLAGQQFVMNQAKSTTNDSRFFSMIPFSVFDEDYCIRFRPHQDEQSLQAYISFSSNNEWYITWGENIGSVALKSDYANTKNLKGFGFYHVAGATSPNCKIWPLIYQKFSIPNSVIEPEILQNYASLPQDANIDSILSVNQALIMTAINLTDNPFLPDKPSTQQLVNAKSYGFEYKNLLKTFGMFFTILSICSLLGLAIAMFDEKIRALFFYDNFYLFVIPTVMILITLSMRIFGLILNSGMEFIIGGLCGLGIHYAFRSYTKKKSQLNENTP